MSADNGERSMLEILILVLFEEFGAALTLEEARQRAVSIQERLARRDVLLMTAEEVVRLEERAFRHDQD